MRTARLTSLGFVISLALGACSSGGTGPDTAADAGADAATDGPGATGPRRVFVTSQGFTGNFTVLTGEADGLTAADVLCNRAAAGAGLRGTFTAYLSVPDTHPGSGAERLAWDRIAGSGPWVAVGSGDVVFADRAALRGETLPAYRSLRTEKGEPLPHADLSPTSPRVWTGTPRAGDRASGDTCANWTIATASGKLAPGMCGCLGEHCQADDWREHRYGVYPGICFCENPPPYEDDQPRLYCFERG